MTDLDHDHHGPDDGYCDLHGFHKIGEASTGNGVLSIVAPYYARTLGEWWDNHLEQGRQVRDRFWRESSHEIKLEQITHSVTHPQGYKDWEQAMLIECENGYYDVSARYCDRYGTGHMSICELRIDLHHHELDDEDDEDDEEWAGS